MITVKAPSKARRGLRRFLGDRRALSVTLPTVIISSAILIMMGIATFVSANILELQIQNTEFEQAKMNMMLLDEIIEDVSLKQGSGSYLKFNLRTGSLSVVNGTGNLKVFVKGYSNPILNTSSSLTLAYHAGSLASGSEEQLRGTDNLTVTGMSAPLCFLRVKTGGGLWIRLDYDRIRLVDSGLVVVNGSTYHFLEVTFLRVVRGSLGGSERLNLKAQNAGISVSSTLYQSQNITIRVESNLKSQEYPFSSTAQGIIVTVTEVQVKISTI